jgi:sugar porter (SP) family MFS transporter
MNKRKYLIVVCLISALGGFLFGYDTAVISGTITFVSAQFTMDSLLEGWFVGSALLGCIIGVSFAGVLADRFGRKRVLLLSALLFGLSAIGCTVPTTLTQLVVYRLIGGLGVGMASILSPLYISEISPPEIRGRMVSLYQFAITIGILCAYFANAQLLTISLSTTFEEGGLWRWIVVDEVWRAMFGAEAIPALLFFAFLFLVPESPRWLMATNRQSKAQDVLLRFVDMQTAQKEMEDIRQVLAKEHGTWGQLFQPGIRLALLIGVSLGLLSQFTGINAIIYYGPRIFESAGFGVGGSLGGQVLIGVVNVLFTLIAIWKIDQLGRRALLMAGCTGMMVSHIVIGTLFYTGHSDGMLLMVFVLCFTASFSFSYGPVVWTLLSEIFPTSIRGRAMSIATLSIWVGTYLVGQLVPWLFENITTQGTFWLFAGMCIPAILIVWKLVPETKGRTLEEIEQYWLERESGHSRYQPM